MPNIEDQPWAPSGSAAAAGQTDFSWMGLIGTLLVFILILIVALWLIRRLNRSALRGMNTPWARVLDRQMLGGQQVLYLVEIAGKLQVLAGSDHHLVKISEIDNPDIAAEILDEIAHRSPERLEGTLSRFMQKLLGRKPRNSFPSNLDQLLEEVDE